MKKILFVILSLFLFSGVFTLSAQESVNTENTNKEIIYYEDGSYIIISIFEEETLPLQARTPSTKTATKHVIKYDKDDVTLWEYILEGTFSIEIGRSAVCTNASYTVDIYKDSWKFSDGDAYTLNNIGYGVGTFKKKLLGVTIQTVEIDLSISSDIYGNIS